MKRAIILLSICAFALSASLLEKKIITDEVPFSRESVFQLYQSYNSRGAQDAAFETFYQNFEMIYNHMHNPSRTYDLAVNRFTFMTKEEIKRKFLNAQNCSATIQYHQNSNKKTRNLQNIPDAVDWRDNGVITPVKDQRDCGSCWTFSTTGCLEAHWAIKTGVNPSMLSEQHLIDCSQDFNNFGCNGGLPSQAFEFIKYNGGIASEDNYYYLAQNGSSCSFDPSTVSALAPGGSVNITYQDEDELLQTVANIGPVSVAFSVQDDFMQYSGGIYNNASCPQDPGSVNHAVLVVGYGSENGINYWIVKNSWNEHWGENGYFRIARGVNMCGIADCAAYPDVNGTQIDMFNDMGAYKEEYYID